jgi:Flp pilus assembly protein TadB
VSVDRLIGVAGGVCVGIGTVQWLGQSALSVGLVLLAGLLIGMVLRLGPNLNIQAAASGLLVFANPDPTPMPRRACGRPRSGYW